MSSKNPFAGTAVDDLLREILNASPGATLSEHLLPGSPFKDLLGRIAELALEEELEQHLGYPSYQRNKSGKRENTRNGTSKKTLKSSHGPTEIAVPRDRIGSFEPHFVPKHQGLSRELEEKMTALYTQGMSTREINDFISKHYGLETSEVFVSRLTAKLDEELTAWRNRPLDSIYAIVFVDAFFLKVRRNHKVESTAFYHISGYGEDGKFGVLGLYVAPVEASAAESASFWHQALIELKNRGLEHILLLCGDDLSGLEGVVELVYPNARFQPCVVHFIRNTLKLIPIKERQAVARSLREVYTAVSLEAAELALCEVDAQWGSKYPSVLRVWKKHLHRLANLFTYGENLRKLVYTTNSIENRHRAVKKVTKTKGSFPNQESALRLTSLILRREHQKAIGKKARGDWSYMVGELHLHFPHVLPENWGLR